MVLDSVHTVKAQVGVLAQIVVENTIAHTNVLYAMALDVVHIAMVVVDITKNSNIRLDRRLDILITPARAESRPSEGIFADNLLQGWVSCLGSLLTNSTIAQLCGLQSNSANITHSADKSAEAFRVK